LVWQMLLQLLILSCKSLSISSLAEDLLLLLL